MWHECYEPEAMDMDDETFQLEVGDLTFKFDDDGMISHIDRFVPSLDTVVKRLNKDEESSFV
jgi:chaperonin cofactor prefoldin